MRWILNCDLIFALDFIDENLLLDVFGKLLINKAGIQSWKIIAEFRAEKL